ncbi:hypothetical protein PDG61_10115 [Mycolicibacterium sp. BiH015]|uniref:hypothetical protein n=1 Tax=Mycolicibacterium sp. BiH015 TaxID=3018808 RepID=UPI0022E2999C|nr:hypothetical protein [Mycolicibacterium sp. BiH015]MDA2891263.1 hypothetical protein [Mycolicibacterium sp. BiH015]
MTTIGYATLQLIPSLRGVSQYIKQQTRGLSIDVDVDVSGARAAGRRAGRDVRSGIGETRIAAGLHRQVEDELSSSNAVRTGRRFGASLATSIMSSVRSMGSGFDAVASGGAGVLRNIGAIATGTKLASVAAQGLSRSLLAAGGALSFLGGGGVGRLAVGLGLVSRAAGGAARDIGRITSSLLVLYTVGRGLSFLNNIGKYAAVGTMGLTSLLGVATGVAALLGGPMVSAITAMAAAMGVAAGAATGILGPALLTLGLGFKGMQDAAKAYTSSDGGASQAKAVAAASRQVEQAEKGVERAKRDARDAERDLTRARKDAVEQIEDMQLALSGAALSEKEANLALLEAKRDLADLGKDGQSFDMIDREQAILRVEQAEQRLAEIVESNGDLAEKAAEQNRVGVEGSDEVVAAKERVADANQAVIDSQQQLADAMQAVADAQNQGQSGIDSFDAMIGQRLGPALDAVKNLRNSITDNLTTALAPAFSSFIGLVDKTSPKLVGLSGVLGTVGAGVATALSRPEAMQGINNMLDASTRFFSAFTGESGMAGLTTGLVSFAGTAAKTFAGVGVGISDSLQSVGDWLRNITPAQMTLTFEALQQVFENIRNVVGPIIGALRELAGISAPALAPGFQALGDAIAQATPGVMAMARDLMPALGQVMQNLAPVIPSLVNAFTPWATIVAAIAPPIATLVSHLGPLAPVILGVTLAAKGIGAAMFVWQTAMAAASIAQGVFAAATGASSVSLGTNTIALAAHRVALIAGSAATTAITGAQWLLNAALNANPIGLIVLALAGLVAGLVYAYNNSETFRNIVQAAWEGIKTVMSAVWDWVSVTLWPGIKAVFQGIGDAAGWLWNNAIKPAWDGIKTGIEIAWTIIKVVFEAWKTEWQLIGDGAMWLWNNAIAPAWEGIKAAFSGAWDFVSDIFDRFKSGWDVLKTGVVGAADAIKSGVKQAFSGLAEIIKAPLKALGSFLENIPTEVLGITVPGADTLNNWGKTLKELSGGGYTGALPVDQIAGVVHGDEWVIQARSRRRIENAYPGLLDYMNNNGRLPLPGYEAGGLVGKAKTFAVSMDPAKYLMGGFSTKAIDCSGFVSAVANVATGRPPFSSRMSTVTEGSWLKSLGFKEGRGGAGDLRVGWWDRGGGANGHTAGTFPDGTNFESNGSEGVVIGGKTGAGHSQFTNHAYLPGEANAGNPNGTGADANSASPLASGDSLFSEPGAAPMPTTSTSSGGSSVGGLPTSFSEASKFGLDALNVKTRVTPNSPERSFEYGQAAGEAISGQVSSLLDVSGVGDSPGWLKAASTFVSGLKIGGNDPSGESDGSMFDGSNLFSWGQGSGASVAPLAATSTATGTLPPTETAHGGRAGQQPGPSVVYNIQARDAEGALEKVKRQERERTAAKLGRF